MSDEFSEPVSIYGPIKEATTPDEMRREFERLSHYDPMVRQVFDMARYNGLSGEDKYLILAYYLIRELRPFQRNALKMAMLDTTHIIPTHPDKEG